MNLPHSCDTNHSITCEDISTLRGISYALATGWTQEQFNTLAALRDLSVVIRGQHQVNTKGVITFQVTPAQLQCLRVIMDTLLSGNLNQRGLGLRIWPCLHRVELTGHQGTNGHTDASLRAHVA